MDNHALKKSCEKRLTSLKNERSEYIGLWKELADHIVNHRGKFLTDNGSKKRRRNTKQPNNTPIRAARTLQAGMMTGLTNPSKPWFSLTTPDTGLMDYGPVRTWLHQVELLMRHVFARSNYYNTLSSVYLEQGVFGTASMGMYGDFNNIIRCQQYSIGSYSLGLNGKNEVDTQYREFTISAGQCVKWFGEENVSDRVRGAWKNGNTEMAVEIVHVYEPNDNRDSLSPLAIDMPIRSAYYEKGCNQGRMLKVSGFEEKAIFTPRWEVLGESVYSDSCPGVIALGDSKALQISERKKMAGVDKMVDPPLQVPSYLQGLVADGGLNPGEKLYVPNTQQGIRSIYDVNLPIQELRYDINEIETRINQAMYVDLFLMLANSDRRQITAREIEERHEEKLLMLSPVLERLFHELLDPSIERCFALMQRAEILPPPPEELADQELKIEYVSALAQAMKRTSLSGIDATAVFAMSLASIWPEARHKVNAEQMIDEYAQDMGISPKMIRSDEEVAEIKAEEQRAIQQQQMMEQMAAAAQTAKTASEIDPEAVEAVV